MVGILREQFEGIVSSRNQRRKVSGAMEEEKMGKKGMIEQSGNQNLGNEE